MKINFKFLSLFIFILMGGEQAYSYIPKSSMIFSRTALNHGNGFYKVDVEVSFPINEGIFTTIESWYIKSGEEMRLEVRKKSKSDSELHATFLYQDGKKYFLDENGIKKVTTTPLSWIEPYFHFRSEEEIRPRLISQKILTPELNRTNQDTINNLNKNKSLSGIRLARTLGIVSWAFGPIKADNSEENSPGLWIEQDQFHVRKIRFNNGHYATAEEFSRYGHGLYLPNLVNIHWKGKVIPIRVLRVQSLSKNKKNLELFSLSSLNYSKSPALATKLSSEGDLAEFYSNFR